MGGMGFISANHATILRNNALINLHTLEAARLNGVSRYLFSSSACIYPEHLQTEADVTPLKEEDAYPADPQDAYGWEKLVAERLCLYYAEEFGMETRIVALPQHLRARTAPTTAAGRRHRRRSAARSPWPSHGGTDRDLGRRRADPLLLLRRRLRRGHLPPDAVGLPRAAQPRHRPLISINELAEHHHRALRQAGHDAASTSTGPRASGAATPTTPGCARCSAGSRPSRSRRAARDLPVDRAASRAAR